MISPSQNALRKTAAAAVLIGAAFAAQAANVNIAVVTGTAGITNVGAAADGVTPADSTPWTTDSAYWSGFSDAISLKFDKAYYLSSLTLTADWNDVYRVFGSADGVSYVQLGTYSGLWDQPTGSSVNFGQVTLATQTLPPLSQAYTFAKIVAVGGDGSNSVGEIAFSGVAAVPEPETYAMLLAGLGVLGFMGKRRKTS